MRMEEGKKPSIEIKTGRVPAKREAGFWQK